MKVVDKLPRELTRDDIKLLRNWKVTQLQRRVLQALPRAANPGQPDPRITLKPSAATLEVCRYALRIF